MLNEIRKPNSTYSRAAQEGILPAAAAAKLFPVISSTGGVVVSISVGSVSCCLNLSINNLKCPF